ncbi:hypothetical protein AVEN_219638-1, partial [Araneus ventricosus]
MCHSTLNWESSESCCCVFTSSPGHHFGGGIEPGTFGFRAEHPNHETIGIPNVRRWILANIHM